MESQPYTDYLKRLLVINKSDCLDLGNEDYTKLINSKSIGSLINEGYIRLNPQIKRPEHETIKTYILISFDDFEPTFNPEFRDCIINFDIICHLDAWCLEDYQIRPLKICGYIDGILNGVTEKNKQKGIKLSGIGEYDFIRCSQTLLNEEYGMYTISFRGVHFTEDKGPIQVG